MLFADFYNVSVKSAEHGGRSASHISTALVNRAILRAAAQQQLPLQAANSRDAAIPNV